jgi:type VI secretion system secreted protein Hcp
MRKQERDMAMDLFLKIDDVKGEADDAKHKGDIELLSWTWGLTRAAMPGGSSGKANVQEVRFTKVVDKSTPNLIKLCCSGSQIKQAVLVVRTAGSRPLEYLKVTLEDAIVSSYTTGATGPADDMPTDSFSLTFSRVKMEYTPRSSGEPAVIAGWNIAANEPWS